MKPQETLTLEGIDLSSTEFWTMPPPERENYG